MNLHYGFERVLNDCSTTGCSGGRDSDAERECLGWAFSKVGGTCQLFVALVEHVFLSLVFLEPLVVGKRDPDQFIPAFDNPCFYLYSFGLDVLFTFDVYLASDGLSFLEGRLVEVDPDLTFRMR